MSILCLLYGIHFQNAQSTGIQRFTADVYTAPAERVVKVKKRRAGYSMPWRRAAPLIMGGGLLMAFLIYCVVGVGWISIVGSLSGLLFPKLYVDWRIQVQTANMEKELEQALETMGTVLRSGGNMPDAFERASVDAKPPLNLYLVEAGTKMRTGVSQAQVINDFQQQVQIKELSIVNVGMELSRLGAPISMSEVFFDAQRDIVKRIDFKRQVKVVVAENKIAGWVVGIMPFLLLGALRQLSPEMLQPLFNTPDGLAVFFICTTLIFAGIYFVVQIATAEV